MFIIYKALHISSGKFYIGQTQQDLQTRIGQHWGCVPKKRKAFQTFLHSTKMSEWEWIVLHTAATYKESRDCEMYYINTLKAYELGLNSTTGGWNSDRKFKASERMAKYRAENPEPWHKGRKGVYSQETLDRMSLAKLRNPVRAKWTEERKLAASKQYGTRVKELKSGLEFDSISKAAKHFNLRRECVRDVVNGRRQQTAGLVFISI